MKCGYTVAVDHNIIIKEEISECDSVLVYISIILEHIYVSKVTLCAGTCICVYGGM